MQELSVEIPGLLFNKTSKRFTFTDKGLIIENTSKVHQVVEVRIDAIQSFRFGISWIRGRYLIIGRHFSIELKDNENYIVPIKFSSYYGLRKKVYSERYNQIINTVWEHYFAYQLSYYTDLYVQKETFQLVGVDFKNTGIKWDDKILIRWEEIAISSYTSYFAIRHVSESKFNKLLYYASDWNAFLLKVLLERIIDQHKKAII